MSLMAEVPGRLRTGGSEDTGKGSRTSGRLLSVKEIRNRLDELSEKRRWKTTPAQELCIRKMWNELGVPSSQRKMPEERMQAQKLLNDYANTLWVYREQRYQAMLEDIRPSAEQVKKMQSMWEDLNVSDDKKVIPWSKEEAQQAINRMEIQKEYLKRGIDPRTRG